MCFLLPLTYVLLAIILTLYYLRRKYAVPDLSKCEGCSLSPLCKKLGLIKVWSPAKLVKPIPKDLIIKLTLTILAGYIAIVCISLHYLTTSGGVDVAKALTAFFLMGFMITALMHLPTINK